MTFCVVKIQAVDNKLVGEVVERWSDVEQAATAAGRLQQDFERTPAVRRATVFVTVRRGDRILRRVWK